MLIPCPHCGERPHAEFTFGGEADPRRPADPLRADDREWLEYLYLRTNACGPHRELWHHTLGCEQWIEVRRDTLTHLIDGSAPLAAGDPAP